MKLEKLNVYKLSMDIGEKVWNIVIKWDNFTKNIPICIRRKQLIRAIDSVSVNLSEGFGRYHYVKDISTR